VGITPHAQLVGTPEQLENRREQEIRYDVEARRGINKLREGELPTYNEAASLLYLHGKQSEEELQAFGDYLRENSPVKGGPSVLGQPIGTAATNLVSGAPLFLVGMPVGAVEQSFRTVPEGVSQVVSGEHTAGEAAGDVGLSVKTGGERQYEYFKEHKAEAALLALGAFGPEVAA
jgi:hypothetical protein